MVNVINNIQEKNQSILEERESIGMETVHHVLEPLGDEDQNEVADLFARTKNCTYKEVDDICDAMVDIKDEEQGLIKYILYNAHTVLRMSDYVLQKYYFVLSSADSKSVTIPGAIIDSMKNNICPLIDYVGGIDQERANDWYVRFLLLGLDPFADEYNPELAKKMGERALELSKDNNK